MGRERSAPDDWAWRAGAHGAGAQPGGRGAALRASRAVHSSGLPTACGSSAAGTRPRRFPTAEGGLQTHMHFAEGDLGNPASLLASLATLRTGAFPEVTQKKTKGQWGRRSRQKYPLVTTPTEEIQEAKLRTRAPPRIGSGLAGWQAGRKVCKGQGGGVRVLGPAGKNWGITRWQLAGGIGYPEESPEGS